MIEEECKVRSIKNLTVVETECIRERVQDGARAHRIAKTFDLPIKEARYLVQEIRDDIAGHPRKIKEPKRCPKCRRLSVLWERNPDFGEVPVCFVCELKRNKKKR